jgi:cyanophycin synthetase
VKRCVVDVVLETGTAVLNADDELAVPMAEYCRGSVLYFTRDPSNQTVVTHREKGGRVVFVNNDDVIYLATGELERPLMPMAEVAIPTTGHFYFHVENVLATVGAAWAYGLDDTAIVEGLRSYSPAI